MLSPFYQSKAPIVIPLTKDFPNGKKNTLGIFMPSMRYIYYAKYHLCRTQYPEEVPLLL